MPLAQWRNGVMVTARATTSGRCPGQSRQAGALALQSTAAPAARVRARGEAQATQPLLALLEVLATPTFAFLATLRGWVEPTLPRRTCTGQPVGHAGTAPQAGQPGNAA